MAGYEYTIHPIARLIKGLVTILTLNRDLNCL